MNNDEIIWKYLMVKYNNPYGVAALMGNLFVESRLDPGCAESSKVKRLDMTSKEYAEKVNSDVYPRDKFAHDGIGFGLAQWTYWSRKERLYDKAKEAKVSIADLNFQLEYLCWELESYKTVVEAIQTATDIRTCSDIIVKRYEKPANQTEKYLENRAKYGRGYYDRFIHHVEIESDEEVKVKPEKKKYVVATANVNLRSGNSKECQRVGSLLKDRKLPYVAESVDGWFAVSYKNLYGPLVAWISKEFSRIEIEE